MIVGHEEVEGLGHSSLLRVLTNLHLVFSCKKKKWFITKMCNQTIFQSKLVEKGIKKKTKCILGTWLEIVFFNEKGVLLDRYIKRHNFFLVFRQYEHHFTVRQTARTCCLAYSLASTRQQNECLEGKANSIWTYLQLYLSWYAHARSVRQTARKNGSMYSKMMFSSAKEILGSQISRFSIS